MGMKMSEEDSKMPLFHHPEELRGLCLFLSPMAFCVVIAA